MRSLMYEHADIKRLREQVRPPSTSARPGLPGKIAIQLSRISEVLLTPRCMTARGSRNTPRMSFLPGRGDDHDVGHDTHCDGEGITEEATECIRCSEQQFAESANGRLSPRGLDRVRRCSLNCARTAVCAASSMPSGDSAAESSRPTTEPSRRESTPARSALLHPDRHLTFCGAARAARLARRAGSSLRSAGLAVRFASRLSPNCSLVTRRSFVRLDIDWKPQIPSWRHSDQ
eukprot:44240-Prymnesium_polylepis.1